MIVPPWVGSLLSFRKASSCPTYRNQKPQCSHSERQLSARAELWPREQLVRCGELGGRDGARAWRLCGKGASAWKLGRKGASAWKLGREGASAWTLGREAAGVLR